MEEKHSPSELTSKLDPSWTVKNTGDLKSYVPASGSVPSDVEPGIYEGGFQLWECTVDLLEYMKQIDFTDKKVFELGCGRGLPGIYSALRGASSVILQDFNKEVIEKLTIPNAALNKCPNVISFTATAWSDIPNLYSPQSFDILLASETIYRKETQNDFLNAIKHLMTPDGFAIIAAKRFYFGNSGNVFDFLKLAKESFDYEMHPIKDAKVKRDIIIMKFKQ